MEALCTHDDAGVSVWLGQRRAEDTHVLFLIRPTCSPRAVAPRPCASAYAAAELRRLRAAEAGEPSPLAAAWRRSRTDNATSRTARVRPRRSSVAMAARNSPNCGDCRTVLGEMAQPAADEATAAETSAAAAMRCICDARPRHPTRSSGGTAMGRGAVRRGRRGARGRRLARQPVRGDVCTRRLRVAFAASATGDMSTLRVKARTAPQLPRAGQRRRVGLLDHAFDANPIRSSAADGRARGMRCVSRRPRRAARRHCREACCAERGGTDNASCIAAGSLAAHPSRGDHGVAWSSDMENYFCLVWPRDSTGRDPHDVVEYPVTSSKSMWYACPLVPALQSRHAPGLHHRPVASPLTHASLHCSCLPSLLAP